MTTSLLDPKEGLVVRTNDNRFAVIQSIDQDTVTLNVNLGTLDDEPITLIGGGCAFGDFSHADGLSNAIGYGSHSEGYLTKAKSPYSHTEGYYTVAKNTYEHAQGMHNISNYDANDPSLQTIFSIGIGASYTKPCNAVEVMKNGDVYVYGIGSYDGTNPSSAMTLQAVIADILNRV